MSKENGVFLFFSLPLSAQTQQAFPGMETLPGTLAPARRSCAGRGGRLPLEGGGERQGWSDKQEGGALPRRRGVAGGAAGAGRCRRGAGRSRGACGGGGGASAANLGSGSDRAVGTIRSGRAQRGTPSRYPHGDVFSLSGGDRASLAGPGE